MSYGPMCGWHEPCSDCSGKNKRCYCYRPNTPNTEPAPDRRPQLPEGD